MQNINFSSYFKKLDENLKNRWGNLKETSPMVMAVSKNTITNTMYAMYMIETYQYTLHNARSQAVVALRSDCSIPYMKFCLQHAADEAGHEQLALHDVNSLGFEVDQSHLPEPLFETQLLISYIYRISKTGNPLQRLGYSYWAESCYGYLHPILQGLQRQLKLTDSQMTFFVAHADIDTDHFAQVKNIITRTCRSQADLTAIQETMERTFQLTERMLNACHLAHSDFFTKKSDHYKILRPGSL